MDQFVLSNIAKSLDPIWKAQRPPQAPFWIELFDALDRALRLQLLVCPSSRIHERESIVHEHFPVLRRLYEHLANETTFEWDIPVYAHQLHHALQAALAASIPDFTTMPRDWAVRGKVDSWTDRISIQVRLAAADPDPKVENRTRERSGTAIQALFATWAKDRPTFEDVYRLELTGMADAMWRLYCDYLRALGRYHADDAPTDEVIEAVVNQRLEANVVSSLVTALHRSGRDHASAFTAARDFLYSDGASSAPANDISALMVAALARRAASGQKKPPSRGTWLDITAIATYLPFSDAMFVDRQCHELLLEHPLIDRIRGVDRVFSMRNADGFLSWVRSLEAAAGASHVDTVVSVYGEEWLLPFRTILQLERERAERSATPRT